LFIIAILFDLERSIVPSVATVESDLLSGGRGTLNFWMTAAFTVPVLLHDPIRGRAIAATVGVAFFVRLQPLHESVGLGQHALQLAAEDFGSRTHGNGCLA
jgi:hypothetical protein